MPDVGLVAYGAVLAASLAVALRWRHEVPRRATPVVPRAIDSQPHTLTLIGSDGRPNPARYENFPNYPAALACQRRLVRGGKASVVTHSDSGEIRIDYPTMFGPFGRIYY